MYQEELPGLKLMHQSLQTSILLLELVNYKFVNQMDQDRLPRIKACLEQADKYLVDVIDYSEWIIKRNEAINQVASNEIHTIEFKNKEEAEAYLKQQRGITRADLDKEF